MTMKAVDISRGWAGVIFRKKDNFNYYSMDISKTWTRFRKMINGKQTIISTASNEPALLSNVWYNVEMEIK